MSLFSILNRPLTASLLGEEMQIKPLSFGDAADIEQHYGFDLFAMPEGLPGTLLAKAVFYCVLRSNDPRLTEAERQACAYRMTPAEAERLLPLKVLLSAESQAFLNQVLRHSGIGSEDAPTGESGNETAASV